MDIACVCLVRPPADVVRGTESYAALARGLVDCVAAECFRRQRRTLQLLRELGGTSGGGGSGRTSSGGGGATMFFRL